MYLNKILLIITIISFNLPLYSQDKKIDMNNFFIKVQAKKIERLENKLTSIDKSTKKEIISIISKYDKKIFKIRKMVIKGRKKGKKKGDLSCNNKLTRIENHLNMRKNILELQLKKIKELKNLKVDCKIIEEIVVFERKFMRKLRRTIGKQHNRKHNRGF